MTGAVLLVAMLVAVATTGWAAASCLKSRSLITSLLAIFLVGYAEIVLLALALSPFGVMGRAGFVVGVMLCLALALGVWHARGRPRAGIRRVLAELGTFMADPALAVLGAIVVVTGAYLAIVAIATPQLDWDSIAYHLPRAVLWLDRGGIGAIDGAEDVRLSWAPPGAEIVIAFTLAVARSDRYVGLPQLLALPCAMIAVAGIARRMGVSPRAAVFASLAFGCLPIVLLQAPTAFNDLVVGALLLAAFALVLGPTRADLALCVLALALALVTKLTAVLALPVFVLVALVAAPRAWRATLAATLAGTAMGAPWFLANLVRTGSLDGGMAERFDQYPDRSAGEIALRAQRYTLDMFDLSGFVGGDRAWLPIAGAIVVLVAAATALVRPAARGTVIVLVGAGALVVSLPWLVDAGRFALVRVFAHALQLAGYDEQVGQLAADPQSAASPVFSWYGAVFALLWVATLAIAIVGAVRGTTGPGFLALLLTPPAFAVLFAAAVVYDPGRGRFFVFPVGLAAAAFALAYRYRVLRFAVPAATAASVLVTLVHSEPRPVGVELLADVRAPSVWGDDRATAQDAVAKMYGSAAGWVALDRFLGTTPVIAVVARREAALYPLFAEGNARKLVLVRDADEVSPGLNVLVVTPGAPEPRCDEPWTRRLSPAHGYPVFVRGAAPGCDGE